MRLDSVEKISKNAMKLAESNSTEDLYYQLNQVLGPKAKRSGGVGARPPSREKRVLEGKAIFSRYLKRIQKRACNPKTKTPKKSVTDNDWAVVMAALIVDLMGGPGVASVFLAIIYKRGLVWLCKQ